MAEQDQKQSQAGESTPLAAELSADVSPAVEQFMAAAAHQNEVIAETAPTPAAASIPYISFEHVDKSFGDFVVA